MNKIGTLIVLLIAFFNLFPPLFAEGGMFSVTGNAIDLEGNIVEVQGIYYDNVYFTILYLLLTYIAIAVPFLLPKLNKTIARISMMSGAWFFSALLYEVFNFTIPDIILNSDKYRTLYVRFTVMFCIGLLTIMIRETWIKTKKY